jgi:ornithine cyclodeaminase/alanine dehydrogenase-like protein (mu-crystallin family)
MDSIEITLRRTAAASAIATDLLSRKAAETLLICGCGVQGRAHLAAIAPLRSFKHIFAYDAVPERAQKFSIEAEETFRLLVEPVADIAGAAEVSDVIVTVTTARSPLSLAASLRPGAFIAAVGADNPMKNEIAPPLMASAVVIVDVIGQCEVMGDLRAAIAAGVMDRGDVRGELGDVLVGVRPGRLNDDEVIIFDSTGAAFQDLTAAAMIFERAKSAGMDEWIDLQR